jgi:alpha-tubulin suppressor-like RCC1 family protein
VVYELGDSGEVGKPDVPVHCWGAMYGYVPMSIIGTSGATALASGTYMACVLLKDQTVSCWQAQPTPVKVRGVKNAVRIAAGQLFGCAVVRQPGSAGTLWCWGKDIHGGFASNSSNPVQVSGLPGDVLDVVAGYAHVCALVATTGGSSGSVTRQVYCWGANEYGVLGQGYTNGTTENPQGSSVPLRVKGLGNVTSLIGAYSANCAIVAGRRLFCWGSNYNGQLSTEPLGRNIVSLPTAVKGLCT